VVELTERGDLIVRSRILTRKFVRGETQDHQPFRSVRLV
jgi:hypothetical protein